MFQSLFSAMDTPCFCHPYKSSVDGAEKGEGGWSPLSPPHKILDEHQYETKL